MQLEQAVLEIAEMTKPKIRWDGYPPSDAVEGWHWLRAKHGGDLSPWLWTDESGDFAWSTDDDCEPEEMARQFTYFAPCVPPEHPA